MDVNSNSISIFASALLGFIGLGSAFLILEWGYWTGPSDIDDLSTLYRVGIWLFVIYTYALRTIGHELAHATAASLVGWPMNYIQIGFKIPTRTPLCFSFLGYRWIIYSFLGKGGLASYQVTNIRHARNKTLFIILSGPALDIVIVLLLAGFLYEVLPHFRDLNVHPSLYGVLFFTSFGYVGNLIRTLIPHSFNHLGRTYSCDMKLVRETLQKKDSDFHEQLVHEDWLRYFRRNAPKSIYTPDQAVNWAEKEPANPCAQGIAAFLLDLDQDPQTFFYFRRLSSLINDPPELRTYVLDRYLTQALDRNLVMEDPLSEILSRELVVLQNNSITSKGTLGSVLIDLGKTEEGAAMLKEVLEKTETITDKIYSNIFLALATQAEGNLKLAREYAQQARKIDVGCATLNRISALLT